MTDLSSCRVVVTGGAGFLGRAICRALEQRGVSPGNIIVPRRAQCDLTLFENAGRLLATHKPEVVIHAAAEVGGIIANQAAPGRFFFANMAMGLNLVEAARLHNVQKIVHVGTVCAYPKHCPVPFHEDDLWSGFPEETNAPYGIAKKAIFVMLDAYRLQYGLRSAVVLPANLYGPGDNFDQKTSHVIPALIRRFCDARANGDESVTLRGTGAATREFLHVDDAADGVARAAEVLNEPTPVNLGSGREMPIWSLAAYVAAACGYSGEIKWDASAIDGQPRRALDAARASELLGWKPKVAFRDGLAETVAWWRHHRA